jgi:hypothetical protein
VARRRWTVLERNPSLTPAEAARGPNARARAVTRIRSAASAMAPRCAAWSTIALLRAPQHSHIRPSLAGKAGPSGGGRSGFAGNAGPTAGDYSELAGMARPTGDAVLSLRGRLGRLLGVASVRVVAQHRTRER